MVQISNILIGALIGIVMGLLSAFMGPLVETKDPDRAIQGLLMFWKRSGWQTVVLTVLIAPFLEELLFRWAGISILNLVIDFPWPIIIMGIAFGLAHNQFPLNFIGSILGIVLGLVYWHYGLMASVAAHGMQNAVVLLHLWIRFQKRTGISLTTALQRYTIAHTIAFYETGLAPIIENQINEEDIEINNL